jgi:dTDP-4-amino-4,6-dideoxygalactose transaminase
MNISQVDLSLPPRLRNRINTAVLKTIKSNQFVLGQSVSTFEEEFAEYIGTPYVIALNSGTDALFLSLLALGVKKGDEVILPTMTFIATASSIIHTGAIPVFVDSENISPNLDPQLLEKKITRKTKAIIAVHMNGQICNMQEINTIAKKYSLPVIEDACQAHGSTYKNKQAGSLSIISAFSFYPSKNLGAFGDGGAVVTKNKMLSQKIHELRDHGTRQKYHHAVVGFNSRLDTIQAVVLSEKLKHLDTMNKKRRSIAKRYFSLLKDLPLQLPLQEKDYQPNFHNFVIRVKKRDHLKRFLEDKGISTGIHYPLPLHLQPALFNYNYKKGDFPNAELYASECLSLPMYPYLTTKQVTYIAQSITEFFSSLPKVTNIYR